MKLLDELGNDVTNQYVHVSKLQRLKETIAVLEAELSKVKKKIEEKR